MDNSGWGNSGSADNAGRGTSNLGSFTRLLETGVYPKNYPNFNSGNGRNELPNFNSWNGGNELGLQGFSNYPRAHQQSNELCQNGASYANPYHGEGYANMPWINRFATTGQGDVGPSDNVPRDQQFVEQYNSSPHLHASSDFRQSHDNRGHGTEPQARYDN